MMSELLGASAIAPLAMDAWPSVRGIQVLPPSVDFQTPPSAAPMYRMLLLLGSIAMEFTLPAVTYGDPALVGWGPIDIQLATSRALPAVELDGSARAWASMFPISAMPFSRAPVGMCPSG